MKGCSAAWISHKHRKPQQVRYSSNNKLRPDSESERHGNNCKKSATVIAYNSRNKRGTAPSSKSDERQALASKSEEKIWWQSIQLLETLWYCNEADSYSCWNIRWRSWSIHLFASKPQMRCELVWSASASLSRGEICKNGEKNIKLTS